MAPHKPNEWMERRGKGARLGAFIRTCMRGPCWATCMLCVRTGVRARMIDRLCACALLRVVRVTVFVFVCVCVCARVDVTSRSLPRACPWDGLGARASRSHRDRFHSCAFVCTALSCGGVEREDRYLLGIPVRSRRFSTPFGFRSLWLSPRLSVRLLYFFAPRACVWLLSCIHTEIYCVYDVDMR